MGSSVAPDSGRGPRRKHGLPIHGRAGGVSRLGKALRGEASRGRRTRPGTRHRVSVGRLAADGEAGSPRHHDRGSRRRTGRRADGRGDRDRDGRRRLPAERGRRAGGQFRTDPCPCRVWDAAAEGAVPEAPAGRRRGDQRRHDRARSRLRRHRPRDHRRAGRRGLSRERLQGVHHARAVRRRDPRLRPLRPGCRAGSARC